MAALAAVAVLALPAAAAYALTLPRWLVAAAAAAHPGVVFRVRLRRRRAVALTLDDAPGDLTPQLLALLAAHGARATFFVIADAAQRHPQRLADIAAAGHEIGNHMACDEPSWRLQPAEFARQVAAVEALLEPHRAAQSAAAPGDAAQQRRWFRPGHGVFRPHMFATLRAHGLTGALGSAYGCVCMTCQCRVVVFATRAAHSAAGPRVARRWDPRNTRGWLIARLLLRAASPGAVLVAHDGAAERAATLDALARVLPELRRRGIEVLTLSQLVAAAAEEEAEAALAANG